MTLLKQADFEVPGFGEFVSPPTAVPDYAQAILALGPVAYWRLNEQTGTTLADQTTTHPLTLSGSYSLNQGSALLTDSDAAIRISGGTASTAASVLPNSADAPFSMVFWLRSPGTIASDAHFLAQFTTGLSGQMLVTLRTSGTLRYKVIGDPELLSSPVISSAWSMVILNRSVDGTACWYINGELDVQGTVHDSAIDNTSLRLGKITTSTPDVLLDEFAVFDYDLSPEQARWLYGLAMGRLNLPPAS